MLLPSHNSLEYYHKAALGLSVTVLHLSGRGEGRYLIKYLPNSAVIHWEQQAEPHFCASSCAVQILSSCHFEVRCDLGFAPGWCTIKALLGPNKGTHRNCWHLFMAYNIPFSFVFRLERPLSLLSSLHHSFLSNFCFSHILPFYLFISFFTLSFFSFHFWSF